MGEISKKSQFSTRNIARKCSLEKIGSNSEIDGSKIESKNICLCIQNSYTKNPLLNLNVENSTPKIFQEFKSLLILTKNDKPKIFKFFILLITSMIISFIVVIIIKHYLKGNQINNLIPYFVYCLTIEYLIPTCTRVFIKIENLLTNKNGTLLKKFELTTIIEDYWMTSNKINGRYQTNQFYIKSKDWMILNNSLKFTLLRKFLIKVALLTLFFLHLLILEGEYLILALNGFIAGFIYVHYRFTSSVKKNPFYSILVQRIRFESNLREVTKLILDLRKNNQHRVIKQIDLHLHRLNLQNVDTTLSKNWIKIRLHFISEFWILIWFVGSLIRRYFSIGVDLEYLVLSSIRLIILKIVLNSVISKYLKLLFKLVNIYNLKQLELIQKELTKNMLISETMHPKKLIIKNKSKEEVEDSIVIKPKIKKIESFYSEESFSDMLSEIKNHNQLIRSLHLIKSSYNGPKIPNPQNNYLQKKILLDENSPNSINNLRIKEPLNKNNKFNDQSNKQRGDGDNNDLLINLENLTLKINGQNSIQGLNFQLREGESTAIIEINESGLTSLKQLLKGILFFKNTLIEVDEMPINGDDCLQNSHILGVKIGDKEYPGLQYMDRISILDGNQELFFEGNIFKNLFFIDYLHLERNQTIENQSQIYQEAVNILFDFELAQLIVDSFTQEIDEFFKKEDIKQIGNLIPKFDSQDYDEYYELYQMSLYYLKLAHRHNLILQKYRNLEIKRYDLEDRDQREYDNSGFDELDNRNNDKSDVRMHQNIDEKDSNLINVNCLNRNFFKALINLYHTSLTQNLPKEAPSITQESSYANKKVKDENENEDISYLSPPSKLRYKSKKNPINDPFLRLNNSRNDATMDINEIKKQGQEKSLLSKKYKKYETPPGDRPLTKSITEVIHSRQSIKMTSKTMGKKRNLKKRQSEIEEFLRSIDSPSQREIVKESEELGNLRKNDINDPSYIRSSLMTNRLKLEILQKKIVKSFLLKKVSKKGTNLFSNFKKFLILLRSYLKKTSKLYITDYRDLETHPGGFSSNLSSLKSSYTKNQKRGSHSKNKKNSIICFIDSFQNILEFDRLLILSNGRLVENGDPFDLIDNNFSFLNTILIKESPILQYLNRERKRKLKNEDDEFSIYDKMVNTEFCGEAMRELRDGSGGNNEGREGK